MRSAHSLPRNSNDRQKHDTWFPVFRSNDLVHMQDDIDRLDAAYTERFEEAHREGRQHRAELHRQHPWASRETVDDGIAYAARLAALEAVVTVAGRMVEEILIVPSAESVLREGGE